MLRPKRWTFANVGHAIWEARLSSWKYFSDFINAHTKLFVSTTTIWRGQTAAKWKLETSLDRLFRERAMTLDLNSLDRHLRNFQYAARGRRAENPRTLSENEWWALGQHHGLASPLLDWTTSPYVALFFAFEDRECDGNDYRAVWALNRWAVGRVI
jgi:hypothetical protein